jgi:peptidyl-prolyl cis-trans isomerase SurA
MVNIKSFLLIVFFIFIASNYLQSQDKQGDRILAIVGNEIITESDFQYQVQLYARQNNLTNITPTLAQQIFQQLVTEKIILAKAEQDSIEITEEEVNKELDLRVKQLIEAYGSEQKIEELYNMSLAKIKVTMKEDLRKKMKAEKFKRQKFGSGVKVNDKEVREFYKTYSDSLPPATEEYEMYHIFVLRKITQAEKDIAKQTAEAILDSIKNGKDFNELAKKYSSDSGSAKNGGDLGWAKKGTYVKEFEETLYLLNPGEVSGVVESEFGYHIIKLNEKKGDQVKSQHILISFPKLESSDMETFTYLNNIKKDIESGTIKFEDAAIKFSQDPQTNTKGGYIGLMPLEKLDSNVTVEVKKIKQDQISEPVRVGDYRNYGYEIVKYTKIIPEHKLNLEQDYERIKKYTEYFKENKEIDEWINDIKKHVYIDVKL